MGRKPQYLQTFWDIWGNTLLHLLSRVWFEDQYQSHWVRSKSDNVDSIAWHKLKHCVLLFRSTLNVTAVWNVKKMICGFNQCHFTVHYHLRIVTYDITHGLWHMTCLLCLRQEPNDMTRSHPEGAYANTILPNHHHPHPHPHHHHAGHHGVFEDFAC